MLIALADRADDAGMCWPSIATLAQMTCFAESRGTEVHSFAFSEKVSFRYRFLRAGSQTKYVINPEPRSPSVEILANANGAPDSPLNGEPRSPRTTFTLNDVHRNGEPRSLNGGTTFTQTIKNHQRTIN